MDNPQNKKVNICQNHLGEFFEAIKEGNLNLVEKLEHELTPSEACVACAYIFKTNGTVKEALAEYLSKEGFEVEAQGTVTKRQETYFWIMRLFVFGAIFIVYVVLENIIKQLFLGSNFNLLNLNIAEYIIILIVSIVTFMLVDDKFLD